MAGASDLATLATQLQILVDGVVADQPPDAARSGALTTHPRR
jgi:hypothetical protein